MEIFVRLKMRLGNFMEVSRMESLMGLELCFIITGTNMKDFGLVVSSKEEASTPFLMGIPIKVLGFME